MKNQVINFMYFGHNYPYDFIKKVWSEDLNLAQHLLNKFNSMYENYGTMTIFRWFMDLDKENQEILINWVENNYSAF